MKFNKVFVFLSIIFFIFSSKIVVGQVGVYPTLLEKNYENDFKQIKKIILIEPNPKVRFSGLRWAKVSLKRKARVERRTKQMITAPIVRIIGKVTPIINYKPDSTTKVQLQEFIEKLIKKFDIAGSKAFFKKEIKQQQFFEYNKINDSLPSVIDSFKGANYIFLTYYQGEIKTMTGCTRSRWGNIGVGDAYILLINKKSKTICFLGKVIMTPFRDFSSWMGYTLRKLKKEIKKNNLNQ